MIPVRLTRDEMEIAGMVGLRRQLNAVVNGYKPRFAESKPGELFGFHIIGAMAEMAVAKCFGWYWSGHTDHFATGDVGNSEVRWSMRKDLKVRPRDDKRVIAVTGTPPDFLVVGYIWPERAREMVEPTSPRNGPPAFFVPHNRLQPAEDLRWIGKQQTA